MFNFKINFLKAIPSQLAFVVDVEFKHLVDPMGLEPL
jgi:hypothetical protein